MYSFDRGSDACRGAWRFSPIFPKRQLRSAINSSGDGNMDKVDRKNEGFSEEARYIPRPRHHFTEHLGTCGSTEVPYHVIE